MQGTLSGKPRSDHQRVFPIFGAPKPSTDSKGFLATLNAFVDRFLAIFMIIIFYAF